MLDRDGKQLTAREKLMAPVLVTSEPRSLNHRQKYQDKVPKERVPESTRGQRPATGSHSSTRSVLAFRRCPHSGFDKGRRRMANGSYSRIISVSLRT